MICKFNMLKTKHIFYFSLTKFEAIFEKKYKKAEKIVFGIDILCINNFLTNFYLACNYLK